MQTYGQKWRANSASCATAHVPRSFQPLLRLDSTGDVSSVECRCPTSNAQLSVQPTDMNHNPCAMKNLFTNRVLGWSSLSGSQRKMGADMNANMFEYVSGDIMNGNMSSSTYPRDQKVMQPQCGLAGWNYNGRNYVPPVFPCHQYMNSFNNKCHNGLFSHSDFVRLHGGACPSVKVVDQRRQKCQKSDRSRRGHSPRHQKPQHIKQEKNDSASAPKQESSKTDKSEKSSPLSNCDSNDMKTRIEPENMPVKEMGRSILTHRILDDLRNMGFDLVSQNQGTPGGTDASILNDKLNTNSAGCEQVKLSKLNCDSNSPMRQTKQACERKSDFVTDLKPEGSKTCNGAPTEVTGTSETDNSSSQDTNFHVLFIRKNWKKGRPSASKQRRRKMQKAKCAAETTETDTSTDFQDDDCGNSEMDGAKSKSMSFIVGFNQIPSPSLPSNTANFTFSFSEDEDDDSNDDWDSDMNFGHIQAEFSQCDLFNFLPGCNTPSKPINVKVHIKPVEIGGDNDRECLDRLNKAWGIQLSVENDLTVMKKKQSAKKVHFPEDKDLHVVHHMFTWSYAYRSARTCYWENFARDRDRFKRRVQEVEHVLLPVLDPKHRKSAYQRLHDSDVPRTSIV